MTSRIRQSGIGPFSDALNHSTHGVEKTTVQRHEFNRTSSLTSRRTTAMAAAPRVCLRQSDGVRVSIRGSAPPIRDPTRGLEGPPARWAAANTRTRARRGDAPHAGGTAAAAAHRSAGGRRPAVVRRRSRIRGTRPTGVARERDGRGAPTAGKGRIPRVPCGALLPPAPPRACSRRRKRGVPTRLGSARARGDVVFGGHRIRWRRGPTPPAGRSASPPSRATEQLGVGHLVPHHSARR